MRKGRVYLVGAGPGDPGLLTEKGRRCLAVADVVVFDRLVSAQLLALAPRSAEFIYAGKSAGRHTLQQSETNQVLVDLARLGKIVVRLKGGDPFVFGRGGEEALELTDAGVEWEVVPGVTSAVAVPAYAGIPVTHRQVSPSFTVVTGHASDENQAINPDWEALACEPGTLVILMGLAELSNIAPRLLVAGKDPSTPVAIVEKGTTPQQRTIHGTLSNIADKSKMAKVSSPAIIVMGESVRFADDLRWFEEKPLLGYRLITSAETMEDAWQLAHALQDLGADVLPVALQHCVQSPPSNESADGLFAYFSANLADAGAQGVMLETVLGVDAFFRRFFSAGGNLQRLSRLSLAALSRDAACALALRGMTCELEPDSGGRIDERALHEWLSRRDGPVYVEDTGLQTAAGSRWIQACEAQEINWRPLELFRLEAPGYQPVWENWAQDGVDGVWVASRGAMYAMETMMPNLFPLSAQNSGGIKTRCIVRSGVDVATFGTWVTEVPVVCDDVDDVVRALQPQSGGLRVAGAR